VASPSRTRHACHRRRLGYTDDMRRTWLGHVSGVLATGFLVAFLFVPLAWILWRSIGPGAADAFGATLARTLANPYYQERLAFTLGQALLSTLVTVALGLPSALLFSRYTFRGKRA